MTVSDAYGISSEIARKSWQRLWDNESTGRYTYNCIPMVGTKVMFSKMRNIGIAYSRTLLGYMTLCQRKTVSVWVHRILHCVIVAKQMSRLNTVCYTARITLKLGKLCFILLKILFVIAAIALRRYYTTKVSSQGYCLRLNSQLNEHLRTQV